MYSRPTAASKSLCTFNDEDDDLPIAQRYHVKPDKPLHVFGSSASLERDNLLQEVRSLAKEQVERSDRYHDMQSLKADRSHQRARQVMVRRYKDWIREMYMEDWIKVKRLKTRYRFTVKQKADLKRWFDLLDTDGSGEVSVNELEDPLLSVGLVASKQEVVDLIDAVDKDGSGAIGFEEFLHVVFEAGRKSVEAAEQKEQQRAELEARDPFKARMARSIKKAGSRTRRPPPPARPEQGLPLEPMIPTRVTTGGLDASFTPTVTRSTSMVSTATSGSMEDSSQLGLTTESSKPPHQPSRTAESGADGDAEKDALGLGDEDGNAAAGEGNPIVSLQKYHSQTGLGNFSSSINIRRRQLLMKAIKELTSNEQCISHVQEQLRMPRRRTSIINLKQRQARLVKMGHANKLYIQNMTRILQQYQDVTMVDYDRLRMGPPLFDVHKFAASSTGGGDDDDSSGTDTIPIVATRSRKETTAGEEDDSDTEAEVSWYDRTRLKAPPATRRRPSVAQPTNLLASHK